MGYWFVTVAVTVSRRATAIVGWRGAPGAWEGERVAGGTMVKPGLWMASRFAYAAGVTGTLANLLLIDFFVFRFGGLGDAFAVIGMLGICMWFVILGRDLAVS
jgi:hypothetical protein